MGRKEILDEAAKCVLSDRNKAYGNPEDNFKHIADLWNIYLRKRPGGEPLATPLTGMDVAVMMMEMKIARITTNPQHKDSLVDIAGYAACGGDFLLFTTSDFINHTVMYEGKEITLGPLNYANFNEGKPFHDVKGTYYPNNIPF